MDWEVYAAQVDLMRFLADRVDENGWVWTRMAGIGPKIVTKS